MNPAKFAAIYVSSCVLTLLLTLLFFVFGVSDGARDATNIRYGWCSKTALYLCPGTSRGARFIQSLPTYKLGWWVAQ